MDLKIFLLEKNRDIKNEISSWIASLEVEIGVTIDSPTVTTEEFLFALKSGPQYLQGYGIVIFNVPNIALSKVLQELIDKTINTTIFYNQKLKTGFLANDRCFELTEEGIYEDLTHAFGDQPSLIRQIAHATKDVPTFTSTANAHELVVEERLYEDSGNELELGDTYTAVNDGDIDIAALLNENIEKLTGNYIPEYDERDGEHDSFHYEGEFIDDSKQQFESDMEVDETFEVSEETHIIDEASNLSETEVYENKGHLVDAFPSRKNKAGEQASKTEPARSIDLDNKEEIPYERSRLIQKQLFARQNWEEHKSLAIWSPLSRMGVTTFAINFACFLAENRIYAGVLEGLRIDPMLKHILKRYSHIPTNWKSYAKALHQGADDLSTADWSYRNVLFLPLDEDDGSLNWTYETLEVYMSAPNLMDVTLIDLPTGEMSAATIDTLRYVDELWVIVDDSFQEILAWKNYILAFKRSFGIEIKLIFNKHYPFSQVDKMKKLMELEVVAEIPSIHEAVMRNYYEPYPVLYSENVREVLFDPFSSITKQLMGEKFVIQSTVDYDLIPVLRDNKSYWPAILEKIKRWVKGNRNKSPEN